MSKRHLYILVLSLALVGISIFAYKILVLKLPVIPQSKSNRWNIEASVSFMAENAPAKVTLFIPRNTSRYTIVDERFISRGYGLTAKMLDGNRQVVWSTRKAKGHQTLYYKAVVRRIQGKGTLSALKLPVIEKPGLTGPYLIAAESTIAEIKARSADVETMVAELTKQLNNPQVNDNITLLLGDNPSSLKKMEVARQILGLAGIPARIVHGVRLQKLYGDVPLIHWLQVYENNEWRFYDPVSGTPDIPDDYLAWWREQAPLVQLKGGKELKTKVYVNLQQEDALSVAALREQIADSPLLQFSLFSLPMKTQAVYRVLLMVPLGVFLLVILRNVVGVETFGTFMPVLIALSFRETQLLWGIVLFSLIVGLGLSVRFYLEQLKLLLVPRLASVLITVILLMAALSILTHKLGLEQGLSVALFPMVIITMTIERMSIVWEERGATESLKQGLGSLIAAALVYLVMSIEYLRHLVFVFPELLLVLLAGTILLGRYSGYRLLELYRFKALEGEK
ncbi:MAG: UUP1 family membrane protein [Pseudomonadota bacterium]